MKLQGILVISILAVFGVMTQSDDEKEFQKWMKTTFTESSSLRKNIEAKMKEEAGTDADELEAVFKKVEAFWQKRKIEDATKWSQQAVAAAREVGGAARAGDFEKAAQNMKVLNTTCTACHAAHRERLPEGGYIIK